MDRNFWKYKIIFCFFTFSKVKNLPCVSVVIDYSDTLFRSRWLCWHVSTSGLGIRSSIFWANRSFFAKNEWMSNSLKKTSDSFICHEQPEWFAHGRSFNMSDLSDSLTVAHLSWEIWSNWSQSLIWFEQSEQMSKWAMSEWANFQPWKKQNKNVLKRASQFTAGCVIFYKITLLFFFIKFFFF